MQLDGKVALVTGAGRGIGRAICHALARDGAAIAAIARTREQIESVAAEIRDTGRRAIAVVADITQDDQVLASIETVQRELGVVDILVNNAGDSALGRIEDQPVDEWWQQIVVGLRGPYLYTRGVIPPMKKKNWGRIINIASANAKKGAPFVSAYCTAKHGVIGLTRAVAMELAKTNITVNAVCPGYVRTELTDKTMSQRRAFLKLSDAEMEELAKKTIPQGVIMVPEDVAPAVAFLASPGAQHITGEAMNVSAGVVMH